MPISTKLALSGEQLEELMVSCWNMRIATLGPANHINLTPMWFGWAGGRIYTFGRGQKVVNLRRNSECTILVDRNEKFPELQAVMFRGKASVLEDLDAEEADPYLDEIRIQMGTKYAGGHGRPAADPPEPNRASATGKSGRWIVFTPNKQLSWDNFKLKELRNRRQK